jgi:hypothetical protein
VPALQQISPVAVQSLAAWQLPPHVVSADSSMHPLVHAPFTAKHAGGHAIFGSVQVGGVTH